MKRFTVSVLSFLLFAQCSLQAEFILKESVPLNSEPGTSASSSGMVVLAGYTDGLAEPCEVRAKNPVTGKDFYLQFGSDFAGAYAECGASFVAFNSLGEAAFFNNSIFTFGNDSYLTPDKTNRVSFYSAAGAHQATHALPPLSNGWLWNSSLPSKLFTASGVLAVPVARQRAVPEVFKGQFSNSLDSNNKVKTTTDVVVALISRGSGVRIIDSAELCGTVGCDSIHVVSALDNGRIWLHGYRGVGKGDMEPILGWIDAQSAAVTLVPGPVLPATYESPGLLQSVNEKGEMLFRARPTQKFDTVDGRAHVFLVDSSGASSQDLSCQIEFGDSSPHEVAFKSEDSIEIRSAQRTFLNISNSEDFYIAHTFQRSNALAGGKCVRLELDFDAGCRKQLKVGLRSRLASKPAAARRIETKGFTCGGSVRALSADGAPFESIAFVLDTYEENSRIEDAEAYASSLRRTNRSLKVNAQGVARFRFKVPSFAEADFFSVAIQGPSNSGVSNEQLTFTVDPKRVK